MKKVFYENRYPILKCVRNGDKLDALPSSTIFSIKSIVDDSFELEPSTKVDGFLGVKVGPLMLDKGFYEFLGDDK